MKKFGKVFCLLLTLCLLFGLFAACQDNGDEDGTNSIGQRVSEKIWNEQIANVRKLSNLTLTCSEGMEYTDESGELQGGADVEVYMFTDDVQYEKHFTQGPLSQVEQFILYYYEDYFVFSEDSTCRYTHYVDNYTEEESWDKDNYDCNRQEYLEDWFGGDISGDYDWLMEMISWFAYSDFSYDSKTGIYTRTLDQGWDAGDELFLEIKFINNQIDYMKIYGYAELEGELKYSLEYLFDQIGTTKIDLPDFDIYFD